MERTVSLDTLDQRSKIADEFGPEKIHRRGRELREQNSAFLTNTQCLEIHGMRSST